MKTKEEVIKEAYGTHWDNYKDIIDENGWFTSRIIGKGNDIKRDLLEIKCVGGKEKPFLFRPKTLLGLEDNNGWIRIESEEDLPKKCGTYHVLVSGIVYIDEYNSCTKDFREWFNNSITHYRPIAKPKPPLY